MGIVQAQPRDVGAIWNLRNERAQWLSTLGSDQWSQAGLDRDAFINRVHASIKAGETWVWLEDGAVLGTIALDQWADPGLWSAEEREVSLIVHRMMTTRAAAGRGIGTALLQHAEQVAAAQHCTWLRLDAWTTNDALHRYYESQGFRHVRTATDHGTPSGALFERPVQAQTLDAVLLSDTSVYLIPELQVEYPRVPTSTSGALVVAGYTYTLMHETDQWWWNGNRAVGGRLLERLSPDTTYEVACYETAHTEESVTITPTHDTPISEVTREGSST